MQWKRVFSLLLVCLWSISGLVTVQAADLKHFRAMNLVRLSKLITLPDVSLPTLDGKQVTLQSFHGKVLMLNFWATW